MKLTSMEIHPSNSSDVAVLSFKDPSNANPYNVKGVTGLSADQIVNRRYMGSNASQISDLALLNRDVVIDIELNPDLQAGQSYSDLRDALYKYIWSSRSALVELQFKNNTDLVAVISGTISKLDTAQFDKKPSVQITISCEEPMLKAPVPFDVFVDMFASRHFSVTDDESNAPHGFKLQFTIRAHVDSILIGSPDDALPNGISLLVVPTTLSGFSAGDVVHFSSEFNDKYLYVVRGPNTIPIIDAIRFNSVWPLIFPGDNPLFVKDYTNPLRDIAEINNLSYYPTYWGV